MAVVRCGVKPWMGFCCFENSLRVPVPVFWFGMIVDSDRDSIFGYEIVEQAVVIRVGFGNDRLLLRAHV